MSATGYRAEADTLDAAVLNAIATWHRADALLREQAFNALALRIFAHQIRHNMPYARYCASLGISATTMPADWRQIPPVPVSAFKDAQLTTFPPKTAALHFETSGTSLGRAGHHYMENAKLYRAALLAAFDRAMLSDRAQVRFFNVLAHPDEKPQSSLSYMMEAVTAQRGDGHDGWYLRADRLDVDVFITDLRSAVSDVVPVCIAGTAFGLLNLLDELEERGQRFTLPAHSCIMETGGFKGRGRQVERSEFYGLLCDRFRIDEPAIVAEYGMTELTSQYYDSPESRRKAQRVKVGPPWVRSRIVDSLGRDVSPGTQGILLHIDLANRSSAIAIATDDVAYEHGPGFVLCGRSSDAELRGCSLDAEELWSRVR